MESRDRLFGVMTASFVLLGMPRAAIGVAWPSAAHELGRSLGELGLVTVAYGAGYTMSTLASGELTRRFTTGPQLVTAATAAAGGLAVLSLTGAWGAFLAGTLLLGLAGGMLDPAVNTYVAVHRGPRAMGVVHTGFGIGSVLGPLVVTTILVFGASWRVAFGAIAVSDLALAVAFMLVVGALDRTSTRHERRPSSRGRRSLVVLSVAVFFFYAGVAVGTGAWIFSFLTESRGIDATVAGIAVAGFWGALTVSRFVLGLVGDRVLADRALTVDGVASVAALGIVWGSATPWMGIVALIVLGFALGWIFPLEMVLTAGRFGDAYTPWAVGYQIAGGNVGIVVLLGGVGLLVSKFGVDVIAPTLVALAVALLVSIEMLRFMSGSRKPAPV